MAAVARLTRNLSQERATVLAKEAIELSTAGNVEVRDISSLNVRFTCRWCARWSPVDKPSMTKAGTASALGFRRDGLIQPILYFVLTLFPGSDS